MYIDKETFNLHIVRLLKIYLRYYVFVGLGLKGKRTHGSCFACVSMLGGEPLDW